MLTYHEFLREVWSGVNRRGKPVSTADFDAAVLPALSRIDEKLLQRAEQAMRKGDLDGDNIVAVLRFLENNWPSQSPPSPGLLLRWRKAKDTDGPA